MSSIVVFEIVIDPTVQDLRKIIEKIINLVQKATLLAILIIKLDHLLYALHTTTRLHTLSRFAVHAIFIRLAI